MRAMPSLVQCYGSGGYHHCYTAAIAAAYLYAFSAIILVITTTTTTQPGRCGALEQALVMQSGRTGHIKASRLAAVCVAHDRMICFLT